MLPGRQTLLKLRIFRAVFALAKDPKKTEEVFAIVDAADAIGRAMPERERTLILAPLATYPGFAELRKAAPPSAPYDLDALAALPAGTLGAAYAAHMRKNGLKPDFYPEVHEEDLLAFSRLRFSQTHDIIHVLTGFDTTPPGEFGVQAFYMAQLPLSPVPVAILASAFLGALTRQDSDYRRQLLDAVARGRDLGVAAEPILFRRFEDDWARDLEELRAELGLRREAPLPPRS